MRPTLHAHATPPVPARSAARRTNPFLTAAIAVLFLAGAARGQVAGPSADCLPLPGGLQAYVLNPEVFRPTPVTPESKARILQSLPKEGEVTSLPEGQRRKLAGIAPILRFHGRESVYEVKVISVAQARVGLHARVVVLISEHALALLSAEELQAQVAHEVGHEYVWDQYESAVKRFDRQCLRELELLCDGIATVTLLRLGLPPKHLIRGLKKTAAYNRERFGRALDEDSYPALSERSQFIEAVTDWVQTSALNQAGGRPRPAN